MHTIAEPDIFIRYAKAIWSDAERAEFVGWLAENLLASDVIPVFCDCRKVRWSRSGVGKRGGRELFISIAPMVRLGC